jgi:hypothetical protein
MSTNNYKTEQIFSVTPQLKEFMLECKKLGYTNNESAKAMKFDWCRANDGSWWATFKNEKMVSVSGVHCFLDGYRALFRGAQIESRPFNALNKYQLQNYAFVYHLDKQIEWANNRPVYITTSEKNELDRSGKMSRVHRSAILLAKQGVFEFVKTETIYNVEQIIWKLNVKKYYEIRK